MNKTTYKCGIMLYKYNEIGSRLKELRENMGLTQNEMRDTLNLTQPTYSRLEGGASALESIHLDILIETYNVNRHWIMRGIGDKFLNEKESYSAKNVNKIQGINTGDITQVSGYSVKSEAVINTLGECVEKVRGLESALEIQKTVIDMLKSEVEFLRKMLADKGK